MHQLPTIEIWFGTAFPPCGHSGKSNAIMDDIEQLSIREGLRLYFSQVGCPGIEVLSDQGRATSIVPVAVRTVVRKVNPRFCKNLVCGWNWVSHLLLGFGHCQAPELTREQDLELHWLFRRTKT